MGRRRRRSVSHSCAWNGPRACDPAPIYENRSSPLSGIFVSHAHGFNLFVSGRAHVPFGAAETKTTTTVHQQNSFFFFISVCWLKRSCTSMCVSACTMHIRACCIYAHIRKVIRIYIYFCVIIIYNCAKVSKRARVRMLFFLFHSTRCKDIIKSAVYYSTQTNICLGISYTSDDERAR